MLNSKLYYSLFNEISSKTGIDKNQLDFYLSLSIARAYKGVNSALIWEDGTVTVAFLNDTGAVYLKDYVVSKKNFEKILTELNKLIVNKINNGDVERFCKQTIATSFIEIGKYNLIAEPEKTKGFLLDYKLTFKKNDTFKNDLNNIKNELFNKYFFIELSKINKNKKQISCRRFNNKVANKVFMFLFEEFNKEINREYSIDKLISKLNSKTKKVDFFIEFRNKPSGMFVSELSKTLNKILGNVEIHFKK